MRSALATLALVALSLCTATAAAEGTARKQATDAPCAGCRAAYDASTTPVPLLVVLHGDRGLGPTDLLNAWEKHAAKRGIAVLSLKCPVDEGCKGSWWQWNGDPAWVSKQIDAFEKTKVVPIDRQRLYLAGWSGGASYIGMRAHAFQQVFAGIVYHGGGVAPSGACAQSASSLASTYFLVGDGNPLHSLAVSLKKEHEQCGVGVTWQLLRGADHTTEWKALDESGGTIADWLLAKRRTTP